MTQVVLALVLGTLFAVGTFLVLRRDVVRVVWGVAILSQAANVYLVTMGDPRPGELVPIITGRAGVVTDPLVQALVLTAIVIGFGTTAFALVLTYRVYEEHGTIDLDSLDERAPATAETGSPQSDDDGYGGADRPVESGGGDP